MWHRLLHRNNNDMSLCSAANPSKRGEGQVCKNDSHYNFLPCSHGGSFCIKRGASVAVWLFVFMATACWSL